MPVILYITTHRRKDMRKVKREMSDEFKKRKGKNLLSKTKHQHTKNPKVTANANVKCLWNVS